MEIGLLKDEVTRLSKIKAKKFENFKRQDLVATVIKGRIQDMQGGVIFYEQNAADPNNSYEKVYHYLFKVLFKPSPPSKN